jgi:hypothetical protein
LVLEHLVWILRIDDNNVVVIYFRMVRTRSGTRTEPPFIERSRGQNAQDWQDEDPLDNIFSHAPIRSFEPLQGRTAEAEEERVPNQMEEIPLAVVGQQERT